MFYEMANSNFLSFFNHDVCESVVIVDDSSMGKTARGFLFYTVTTKPPGSFEYKMSFK